MEQDRLVWLITRTSPGETPGSATRVLREWWNGRHTDLKHPGLRVRFPPSALAQVLGRWARGKPPLFQSGNHGFDSRTPYFGFWILDFGLRIADCGLRIWIADSVYTPQSQSTTTFSIRSPNPRSAIPGGCSSVGRAPGCGPGGRGFESRHSPQQIIARWCNRQHASL